jgi:small conductance mechanosensitive channel
VTGAVEEVGLFVTSVNTLDNIPNIVDNGKIFGDNPYWHVDPQAQLDHTVGVHATIAALKAKLAKIPIVLTDPAPDVEILSFLLPVPFWRCVRINAHYWQVYFDTNPVIRDTEPTPDYQRANSTSCFASLLPRTKSAEQYLNQTPPPLMTPDNERGIH